MTFYNLFLPAALAFAQRDLAAAAILARPAALIFRLAFLTGFKEDCSPFAFAQRFFAAAAILALTAGLNFRFIFDVA